MTDPLLKAAAVPAIITRFHAKVNQDPRDGRCWIWTGAISGQGHGRFWISGDLVVIAHRFAFAIAHPTLTTMPAAVSHRCDTPVCQNPDHLEASDNSTNRAEWAARRGAIGSPLRDIRGSLGRCLALRAAVRNGLDIDTVDELGVRPVDRDQPTLF